MEFSWHPTKTPFDAKTVTVGWRTHKGFSRLRDAILKVPVSPVIMKICDGSKTAKCEYYKCKERNHVHRCNDNFEYTDLIGLDIDSGTTIDEALALIKDMPHILATTRSHRKDGNGDRFRIFLPLEKRITDFEHYRQNTEYYQKIFKADKACKDCRLFYPCTEIVSFRDDNWLMSLDVQPLIAPPPPKPINKEPKRWRIPKYIRDFATYGVTFGSGRNQSFYISARTLAEERVPDDQIWDYLSSAPIDQSKWSASELKKSISSGIAAGRR